MILIGGLYLLFLKSFLFWQYFNPPVIQIPHTGPCYASISPHYTKKTQVITPNYSPEVGSQVITPNPIADVAPSDIVDRSIYTRGYRLRDWRYRRLTQRQPIMYVQTDAIFTTTCLGSRRYTSGLAHVSYRHIMVFYRSRIHVQQPFLAPDSTWTPQALSLPRSQPLKRFHDPFLYVKKELTEKSPHLNFYLVDASYEYKRSDSFNYK